MSIFSENRNHYDAIEGVRLFIGFTFWASIFIIILFTEGFLLALAWMIVGVPIAFIFATIMVHLFFNLYDMVKG